LDEGFKLSIQTVGSRLVYIDIRGAFTAIDNAEAAGRGRGGGVYSGMPLISSFLTMSFPGWKIDYHDKTILCLYQKSRASKGGVMRGRARFLEVV